MKRIYSCQVSICSGHSRIDFLEVTAVTTRREALREQVKIAKAIKSGEYDYLLRGKDESLEATVDVHDAETYDMVDNF